MTRREFPNKKPGECPAQISSRKQAQVTGVGRHSILALKKTISITTITEPLYNQY